ncbi:MAG: T9SS type A sorting domain-containing protein [Chitinophagales bacterium]
MKNYLNAILFFLILTSNVVSAQTEPTCEAANIQLLFYNHNDGNTAIGLGLSLEENTVNYQIVHEYVIGEETIVQTLPANDLEIVLNLDPLALYHQFTVESFCSNELQQIGASLVLDFTYSDIDLNCPIPTNFVIESLTNNEIILTWQAVEGAESYTIAYEPEIGGEMTFQTTETFFKIPLQAVCTHTFQLSSNCSDKKQSLVAKGAISQITVVTVDDVKKDIQTCCETFWMDVQNAHRLLCTAHGDFGANKIAFTNVHINIIPIDSCFTNVIEENLTAIKINVFPNPFVEYLVIEGKNMPFEESVLMVYNANGELVLQQNFLTSSLYLNTKDLPQGIYFYQLKQKKQKISAGKLVK